MREASTRVLLDDLLAGRIDAVIGTPNNDPALSSISLFAESLWICAANDDPLSLGEGPVSLSDLRDRPLLSLSPGFTLHGVVEQLAREADAHVSRDYQGLSLDAVRQMAVMGAGVAILPSLYALAEAIRDPEFKVRRIDHPDARHEIALHWRRSSPSRDDFLRLADDLIATKKEIVDARDERFK